MPILSQHDGRVVKFMGDGLLAEFLSASEAVQAAVDIQRAVNRMEQERPEEERVRLRIGISLGDVVHEEGDIFGEGVNLAARLQGLAERGGICVSRNVYEQGRNRLPVTFSRVGVQRVKNLAEPVEIWRVDLDGTSPPAVPDRTWRRPRVLAAIGLGALVAVGAIAGLALWRQDRSDALAVATSDILAVPTGPRVGVMPFANIGGDPDHDAFTDGITEEVIAGLTRFRQLHVVARNAMLKYGKEDPDARALGRELGLSYVLEGSVRLSPGTVRITAQLIDATDARHVWSQTYDSQLSPEAVINVQEEIAGRIVSAIGASWGGAIASSELKQALRKPPERFSSYQCFLTAIAWYYHDPKLYRTARDCLRETTRLEPDYTESWAMLSDIYAHQWYGYGELYPGETYDPLERAMEAAKQALFLSPDSARAHYAMAKASLMAGDLESFRSEVQQTLRLNPNEPVFLASLGGWLAYAGWWSEGLALVEKAQQLNPESFGICRFFAPALDHFRKGEYDQAIDCIQKSFTGWWANYMHQAFI
jgi:TolB-like protein/tetratricopeptide (TPR) repeat protein